MNDVTFSAARMFGSDGSAFFVFVQDYPNAAVLREVASWAAAQAEHYGLPLEFAVIHHA
jgi:hypothetical protein